MLQKFIQNIFSKNSKSNKKFDPTALLEFFKILEQKDFVSGGHKGSELVEFLLEEYLQKFQTGEIQNLVELENSKHLYNCLLAIMVRSPENPVKLKLCLNHCQEILTNFDLTL